MPLCGRQPGSLCKSRSPGCRPPGLQSLNACVTSGQLLSLSVPLPPRPYTLMVTLPGSGAYQLGDLKQGASPLRASVSSSVNQDQREHLLPRVVCSPKWAVPGQGLRRHGIMGPDLTNTRHCLSLILFPVSLLPARLPPSTITYWAPLWLRLCPRRRPPPELF